MKYIVSILLLCIGMSCATAQEVYTSSGRPDHGKKKEKKVKGYDPSRLIVGGTGTAGFGGGYVDVGISPFVGYQITNHFSLGVGLGYEYYNSPQAMYNPASGQYENYPSKANIITPNIWTRVGVFRNFYVAGVFEYNMMYFSDYNYSYDNNGNTVIGTEKNNINVASLLVGPGVRLPVSGRIAGYLEVLYDVLQNANSPYYQTVVPRIGISVGL